MAGKHRRTKRKNRDESSDDSNDSEDEHPTKKFKNISFVKREKKRELARTQKKLSRLCDSEESSDSNEKNSRPIARLPIAVKKKPSLYKEYTSTEVTDSDSVESKPCKSSKSNNSSKPKKKKNTTPSDSDSGTIKSEDISRKKSSSVKANASKTKKQSAQSSSSDGEFQKSKPKSFDKSRITGKRIFEDTSLLETPSKSDDETIPLSDREVIRVKAMVIERGDTITKICKNLEDELEQQTQYYTKKKISVLRDAKFMAHKVIEMYKNSIDKLKKDATDFRNSYQSFLDTFREKNASANRSMSKDSASRSFRINSDSSDSSADNRLTRKNSSRSKTNHTSAKPKLNQSSRSLHENSIQNSTPNRGRVRRKNSSQENLVSSKSLSSPAKQGDLISDKENGDESDDPMHSIETIKLNRSFDTLQNNQTDKVLSVKSFVENDDLQEKGDSIDEQKSLSDLPISQIDDLTPSINEAESPKQSPSVADESSHQSFPKDPTKDPLELESSISNAPTDSAQDDLQEKSSPQKKRVNLSLSKSSKETNKSAMKAICTSDSDEPGIGDAASGNPQDQSTSDPEKKSKSRKSKLNLSLKSSRTEPTKPSSDKETGKESSGEVSDCDSDRIFSDKESRKKKSQKKRRRSNHSKSSVGEDVSQTDANVSATSKMESRRKSNVASASDSDELFDSTTSEIPNTPVKSPVGASKSLRKTLLAATMPARISDVDSETELPSEPVKSPANDEDVLAESELAAEEPEAEDEIDMEEKRALKNLLKDVDSDDSSSRSSESDVESAVSKCSDQGAKKKLLKKNRELLMQTKKRNSISSDSSSSHSADEAKNNSSDRDSLTERKRRRLESILLNCRHYKTDKKLRMVCRVKLERLSQRILDKHSRALEKSKKYVANKMIDSATNLDGIESKKRGRKNANVGPKKKKKVVQKKSEEQSDGDEHMESDGEAMNNGKSDEKNEDESKSNLDEENGAEDSEAEAKRNLLRSCSTSSDEDENGQSDEEDAGKSKNSKKKNNAKDSEAVINVSDEEKKSEKTSVKKDKKKSDWKDDKILKFKITDSESEEEKFVKSQEKKKAKKLKENDKGSDEDIEQIQTPADSPIKNIKRQKKKKRVLDSDSDVKISSDEESVVSVPSESEEEVKEDKKKKKRTRKRKKSSDSDSTSSSSEKKKKTKRKRIKKVASDSESDDQESPGKGRKNIRKVLKDKHVTDDTKKAAQDEDERLKRIAERQRLFNEMYDAKVAGEAKVEKLVLDFDEETKEELVVVHKELVKRLKPHQAEGIKFMWTACFESLKQIEKSEGSGCIIAHCMGLGKTFQVVTLAHTLLSNENTGVRTVMIVCPLSTVLNWVNEFKMWLKNVNDEEEIEIYELTKSKKNFERKYQLESWQKTGGVLIIGYEMFRNLTSTGKKMRKAMQESILRSLVDPGADLVVCDEGHLLKNEDSALSKAMKLVKTRRRIVLTGTPLQNNLKEYHCMVQFVKPNLLGTKKEFLNRFVNPISNGQFDDSTPYDVKLMKKRAHVLHKMLEASVQRFDYSVLTPFLPPKQEYVIFVRLTEVQIKMYQYYLDNFARRCGGRNGSLFADFQELQRIWTHPYVLRLNAEKVDKVNEKKRLEASDSEGSLKDFIDDGSESDAVSTSDAASGSGSDVQCIDSDVEKPAPKTRSTRLNPKDEPEEVPAAPITTEESSWWSKYLEEKHFEDMRISTKLLLLFGILKESEQIGDKVLVFSQSLYSLTLIEQFLNLIDQQTQEGGESELLNGHTGTWALGLDYFRLDGSTSAENRSAWCKIFNNPTNTRARLFLISTRAGGLGINLTAANRVIIFDASWNPSHDVQSIFRIYRFGQKKPCYVYRFLAAGTMEEKIYNRQVTKLSLACRVVDEQQIERHYSNNDLAELYQFESYEDKSVTLALPKDRLLAEIFLKYKDSVYNYHEHDSLLENKEEEELDEEERKQAWLEYEDEKQGKRQMVNMGMNMGANNMLGLMMNSFPELESIKLLIQKDYPNLPPEHLETVARQAIYDMYRYVDQQAVNQTLNSFVGQNNMYGGQMQQFNTPLMNQQQQQLQLQNQLMNMSQPMMNYPGMNQMPVYSGRGRPPKALSVHNQMMNINQMQNSIPTSAQMQTVRINDDVEVTDPLALPSNAKDANNKEEE